MRWLRPTVSHETPEEAIEDVVRVLEAAAHEAPPSRRAEAIRQQILEEVGADRRSVPGLVPLAIAASVLVLGLLVGVGGPAVGSWLGDQLHRLPPSVDGVNDNGTDDDSASPSVPQLPQHEDPTAPTRGESPSDAPSSPDATESGEPSPAPGSTSAPAPMPTPDDDDDDDGGPPPHTSPGGPPSPMPTPPQSGPPSGTPGG
jgi:hypothetical protein